MYASEETMLLSKNTREIIQENEITEADCLFEITNSLQQIGVNCWLDQGTLLGLVRDRKFLPVDWDHDFDLGIWAENYASKKIEVLKTLNSLGWKVCQFTDRSLILKHLTKKCRKISIAIYHRQDSNVALKFFLETKIKRNWIATLFMSGIAYITEHLMIRCFYFKPRPQFHKFLLDQIFIFMALFFRSESSFQKLVSIAYFFRGNIVQNGNSLDVVCDGSFFDKLETAKFYGHNYVIPSESTKYLELKYGNDWKTPRKEWDYLKEDGAIKK